MEALRPGRGSLGSWRNRSPVVGFVVSTILLPLPHQVPLPPLQRPQVDLGPDSHPVVVVAVVFPEDLGFHPSRHSRVATYDVALPNGKAVSQKSSLHREATKLTHHGYQLLLPPDHLPVDEALDLVELVQGVGVQVI